MIIKELVNSLSIDQFKEAKKSVPALTGIRTERIQIVTTEKMDTLAKLANNLYNEATYRIHQKFFFKSGTVLSYFELREELKASVNYTWLPAKTAQ